VRGFAGAAGRRLSLSVRAHMTQPHAPSLFAVPRVLWRSFVAVWIFPVFFFLGSQVAGRVAFFPAWLFWVVAVPLFFFGFGRPAFLFFRQRLSFISAIVWGAIAPWLIWSGLVIAQYGVHHLMVSTSAP